MLVVLTCRKELTSLGVSEILVKPCDAATLLQAMRRGLAAGAPDLSALGGDGVVSQLATNAGDRGVGH
jgi:hypothetical protein